MGLCEFRRALTAALVWLVIGAAGSCPRDPNCVCGGAVAFELNCTIDGHKLKINYLPKTYLSIECDRYHAIDYNKLPELSANKSGTFKSVSFKQCPLPTTSFKDVLTKVGVYKTMSLIYQNSRNLSNSLDRKLFTGLQDLSKLSLSINGITYLPDDLFLDVYNLTWLNIRSNSIGFSEKLFKPLDKLETLEISHNHMMNISGNIFSHLALLRKLSLWQSNVTNFSEDLFAGVNVLEELDLSSNGLNELPSSILNPLRKLKKLTLFSNKFSSLPSNLLGNNQELDTIIIFNNDVKLMQLPKSFLGNLPKLKQSYIQRCGLETVPYDLFVNSSLITNISLAYNELKTLPEPVFNDQINLLDLDLSNNKIKLLPSKLFSSLVRLERLQLGYNALEEISSSTFASLLSLTYLNMENNQLKRISSYVFSNNKQRIWINMAYNQLNFDVKESNNSSHKQKTSLSPFAYMYQLKLLNLSHNAIERTFSDWWNNGYEILDLSHNKIKELTGFLQSSSSTRDKRYHHMKFKRQVWISHNPIYCDCKNFQFMADMEKQSLQIMDREEIVCPNVIKISCDTTLSSVLGVSVLLAIIFIVISAAFVLNFLFKHRSNLYYIVKRWSYVFMHRTTEDLDPCDIILTFADKDEDFVEKELISKLKSNKHLNVIPFVINKNNSNDFTKSVFEVNDALGKSDQKYTFVIILTVNYLDVIRNDCKLNNLHSQYLINHDTIFISTDEISSINTIDIERMAMKKYLKWDEPKFWNKLLHLLPNGYSNSDETANPLVFSLPEQSRKLPVNHGTMQNLV